MKTVKMTRAVRRQVYTLDLVFATSLTMGADDGKLPKKTKDVLSRIIARTDNLKRILHGGPKFQLSPRDRKKYLRNIEVMKRMISAYIDNDRLENDFFNAVLMLVEDCREASKRSQNKQLQHEWKMLNQSLFTLYGHMVESEPEPHPNRDDSWSGYKYQVLGVSLGKKFEKVMMQ